MRSGGQVLIDQLAINDVDVIFGVPGESYLAALDALHGRGNAIRYITMRQEGGAAFAAAAWSDLTGRPGLCFVTRGPGAANASIAVHTAAQGSTPLILLVGQIRTSHRDREAFQEVDYRRVFGSIAKWVAEIDHADRIPEYIHRAFRTAMSGRPGPVVLALPEDMLFSETDTTDLRKATRPKIGPEQGDVDALASFLSDAERPLLLLGGTCWAEDGHQAAIDFAETHRLPVAVAFRRQGLFPHDHPNFIGTVGFGGVPEPNGYAGEADLLIALGARLNDPTTLKFTVPKAPRINGKLVHIHPESGEIGRLYIPDLGVVADPNSAAMALARIPVARAHAGALEGARRRYVYARALSTQSGPVDMAAVMAVLNDRLPPETNVTTGAGNASDWPNIYYRYRQFLGAAAPISGAMGMGVPAAIAAKIARPEAPAVYIGGDGDFLMNGQELATAIQYGLDPIFIILDNEHYGTIRGNQEDRYPGRPYGTALRNPDFSVVAEGYGAAGFRIERTEDFAPALDGALSAGRASVIHVCLGPDHLGPNQTLPAGRT